MPNKSLKEKCRDFQKQSNYVLDENRPIIVHIDGRSFSKMVKNKFTKPFDSDFIEIMNQTAKYLCEHVQCCQIAYVQSDEITLVIEKPKSDSEIFFNGRLCKLQSILASIATSIFLQLVTVYNLKKRNGDDSKKEPNAETLYSVTDVIEYIQNTPLYQFDCKAWNVDNANDVFSWILFRNIDCVRNSKMQLAQTYLSHKQLSCHTADECVELAKMSGHNWYDCAEGEKYGRFVVKRPVTKERDGIEFTRSVWEIENGFDITKKDNQSLFNKQYYHYFLDECL